MPGLQDLQRMVQPITGQASMEAAVAALNPQERAMVAQGLDPFGADQGMLGGQPGIAQAPIPGAIPQPAGPQPAGPQPAGPQPAGLSPESRMAIGAMLEQSLAAIGQPASEADAAAAQSIQNALMALGGGM